MGLRLSRGALRYLQRLDAVGQERISDRIAHLLTDPYDRQHSKPLRGSGKLRTVRAGGWRILYTVDDEGGIVIVERIGPRGQVYRNL